jgi:hypothetical protein
MKRLILAVAAAVILTGCIHSRSAPVSAHGAPVAAAKCDPATAPLIVVDGVVQPSTCSAPKTESPRECAATAPVYVVDGVRMCAKPPDTAVRK